MLFPVNVTLFSCIDLVQYNDYLFSTVASDGALAPTRE